MNRVSKTLQYAFRLTTVAMVLLFCGVGPFAYSKVDASQIQLRKLQLSDSIPNHTSEYIISMTLPSAGTLGSLKVDFCSNLALLYYPCTPPAGFTLIGASIIDQTGVTDFTIDPSTTANTLILTRPPSSIAADTAITIKLTNVHNQTNAGSSFARYYTYPTADASGADTDAGAVAYVLNDPFGISAEVPPYLTICVAQKIRSIDCSDIEGNFLQLGEFNTARASSSTLQTAVSTNAENGYNIRIVGPTMTSGNNIIPSLDTPTPSAPGNNQFGINLRSNTNPSVGDDPIGLGTGVPATSYNQPNRFKYASGDVIAAGTTVEDYRKFTVSYLVNINRTQPAGVYSSSFSYIGLGNF